jgi:hypothetical protein
MYCLFCVVLCLVFVCIRVLYYCHRVATQLQLNISYINSEEGNDWYVEIWALVLTI